MDAIAQPRATIRQWRLKNFKSIRDAKLDFAPLTLLVGENSAGKSSVLQSIRLVVQSVRDRSGHGGVMALNGHGLSLGTFQEVRSSWSRGGKVWIGADIELFEMPVAPSINRIFEEWEDGPRTAAEELENVQRQRVWKRGTFRMDFGLQGMGQPPHPLALVTAARYVNGPTEAVERSNESFSLSLSGHSLSLADLSPLIASAAVNAPKQTPILRYVGKVRYGRRSKPIATISNVNFEGPFPTVLFEPKPGLVEALGAWLDALKGASMPDVVTGDAESDKELLFGAVGGLVEAAEHAWKVAEEQAASASETLGAAEVIALFIMSTAKATVTERLREAIWRHRDVLLGVLPSLLADRGIATQVEVDADATETTVVIPGAARTLAAFFATRVSYLGPLREDPHSAYQWPSSMSAQSLGAKGEFTAAALLLRDSLDPMHLFSMPLPSGESDAARIGILEAVSLWLRYFGVALGLEVDDSPSGPVVKVIERDGRSRDLTQVGVGVSQLLPVIVQCLVAKVGSVVMLEQPELHLHPALQQKLGDFLLACAMSGRQLVVETHSEHIVTRLRRAIAQSDGDELVDVVQFLFAEKADDGETRFRPVKPNQYGGIDDWPRGFFDESVEESRQILKAASRKHRLGQTSE